MTTLTAITAGERDVCDEGILPSLPVLASTQIWKGAMVAIDTAGYAVPAGDTSAHTVMGVATESKLGGTASGDVWVKVQSGRAHLFAATELRQSMVGDVMYVVDDNTFHWNSTNGIVAGTLVKYVDSTHGYILVGPTAAGIPKKYSTITATPQALNKAATLVGYGYPLMCETRTFTETAVTGTYTATIVLPAGSVVFDVLWQNHVLWTNGTSAAMQVRDTETADGYWNSTNVKTTPAVDVDGAGGWSTRGQDGAGDAGAYSGLVKFTAAGTTITGVVTTGAGNQATGVSRLTVIYAVPTGVAATKV
jgi:hypothetical protein